MVRYLLKMARQLNSFKLFDAFSTRAHIYIHEKGWEKEQRQSTRNKKWKTSYSKALSTQKKTVTAFRSFTDFILPRARSGSCCTHVSLDTLVNWQDQSMMFTWAEHTLTHKKTLTLNSLMQNVQKLKGSYKRERKDSMSRKNCWMSKHSKKITTTEKTTKQHNVFAYKQTNTKGYAWKRKTIVSWFLFFNHSKRDQPWGRG